MGSDLDDALAALAPPGVRVGSRSIDARDVDSLRAEEVAAVAGAVDVRRREFATGRALLRELIPTDVAIPVGATRAPMLPAGVVASLAHDRSVAVAAVTRHAAIAALGIDVEGDEPLPPEMARIILRPDEADLDAHLAFCLKEAAYKAWSTLGGRLLDHHDVRLRVLDGEFTAELDERLTVRGRFARLGGRSLALVVVAH